MCVAVIAHELAHIFLNHTNQLNPDPAQETEVWQTLDAWGFSEEVRAYRQYCKNFESRRKAKVRAARKRNA
jgi:hypothetical protein